MHAHFHMALENCDVALTRKMSAHLFPHLPQPKDDAEALVVLHRARTEMPSMALKLRAYSHRWLLDHGYPSALPDEIKPRAERMYPTISEAVGISVHTSRLLRPVGLMIRGAMEGAVMDAYAGSKSPDPALVRARMMEARESIGKMVREAIGDLAGPNA